MARIKGSSAVFNSIVNDPGINQSGSSWTSKSPALGIDLGGTKLAAAIVSGKDIISEARQVPTPIGPQEITQAIVELIEQFRQDELVAGVGIATAGIVNTDSGQVVGSTGNLPGWEGTAIKQIIENRTMLPVHVENDANAAAYAECKAAGMQDKTCIVTVTLGTGIGAGIVIHGKLYRGAHFAAGESGHIRIDLGNQRLCTCGLWDCWEAFASGRGLLTTAENLLASAKPDQSELLPLQKVLTTQQVVDAAGRNDPLARKAVDLWHEHIGAGLVSLAHTLDPDCFILSGGMSKYVDFALLKELTADRTLPRISEKLDIRPATLGNEAGMVGAAMLVLAGMDAVKTSSGRRE